MKEEGGGLKTNKFFNGSNRYYHYTNILHFVSLNSFGEPEIRRFVPLNLRAGSTFPVLVCTVSPGHWVNKAGTK